MSQGTTPAGKVISIIRAETKQVVGIKHTWARSVWQLDVETRLEPACQFCQCLGLPLKCKKPFHASISMSSGETKVDNDGLDRVALEMAYEDADDEYSLGLGGLTCAAHAH